jgi:hypothetical protein
MGCSPFVALPQRFSPLQHGPLVIVTCRLGHFPLLLLLTWSMFVPRKEGREEERWRKEV